MTESPDSGHDIPSAGPSGVAGGLAALLVRQAGVISRAQAIACGMSGRTVARRASTGAWCVIHPGVYLVAGHRPGHESRVRAAALWAGPRATLSGPAAAFWHRMLDEPPGTIGFTVPRTMHRVPAPGVTLRRRVLDPADRTVLHGVAVTTPTCTVLETAPVAGPRFLDRALQRHVGFAELHAAYCRHMGARGNRGMGELLVACADRADSVAERRMMRLLREAGVTGWVHGHRFGPWTLDLAFPERRLAIEVDGWAWHVDAERFAADRRKGNALGTAGWVLLRFTWADLTGAPELVVRRVREVLAAAA
ncbi:DUF559 domain-containing protein [Pseudonocardia sp. DR1-2]|uniref:type IV toxin-antitoxin system AbiEi family antitoxin domain-containing protein n=1 Tax=Pseudonocardia sp. DR1-2 TaxID=2951168 RepID=UPI002044AA36|nr:type IV toxin-antitoxin system AbiEi family antitoxin domain-containing protein [Pseudonocardia sp. DR1-2]MCM3845278.1 DUF559 domain-containing protein [Pseudonocardia sp. DR1-2]